MKIMNNVIMSAVLAFSLALGAGVASADTVTKSGQFKGENKHITTGGVSVVKTSAGGMKVILGKDFNLDGAPDPYIGFGKNGKYDRSANLGKLINIKGQQVFVVPANVDVSKYNEVYVWCKKFTVSLGVAAIK